MASNHPCNTKRETVMKANRILYVAKEVVPFTASTVMSETCRHLPQAIQEMGHEIRTFMPKWGCINERRNQLHEVIRLSGMNLIINDTDHPLIIKVASLQMARMQVYFIDNDDYFSRIRLDDPELRSASFKDNDERTIFFARGVLETMKKLRWYPDVIHLHGWVGMIVGLYAKVLFKDEPAYRNSRIIVSLYADDDFDALFCDDFFERLRTKAMPEFDTEGINTPMNSTELFKLAIKYSDGVIVNAPSGYDQQALDYARQIGKPILDYPGEENYYNACHQFYELICGGNEEEEEEESFIIPRKK